MREAYIVKKSVKRSPLKPKEKISREEYEKLVDNSAKLTWYENTKHGKRSIEREPIRFKYRMRAYINYDENDESTWASMLPPFSGFISIQFDYKSSKQNLHDLIDLAETIGCNLWQYKPKRQILNHEIVENRYKRK